MLRDDLDRQIIACLARNARMPYPAIGDRVGLSAPAVKRRIDRLVADGTITSFTVTLDPAAMGTTTEAFVELHCRGRTSPEEILEIAVGEPSVVAAYTVTGDADAVMRVRCEDNRALERTLEHIRSAGVVERTTSKIVLSRLMER